MPETAPRFTHGDYTVGWICALPETELVAAGAMLDEEHPVLAAADPKDANSYLLGRIGTHNVVIACLPAEETGKVNAATVATNMVRSFKAVRFGLMVGIGGGAPYYGAKDNTDESNESKSDEDSEEDFEDIRDIRLGDVVISLHSKSSEAVVQYDFGKSVQERRFIHTGGKLNKPPNIVLNAVAMLRGQHKRKGHKISERLSKLMLENPLMDPEFRYPGSTKDQLFKSGPVHPDGRKSCKACCGPLNVNLVKREARSDDAPRLHYGTIGSADRVMRDATLRDEWAQEEKIICFEMEAAGLMDSFPCLVIRGICDYADSHKNKIWQPYAAATAAAYAKEFLLVIPGQSIKELSPIEQILADTYKKVDEIIHRLHTQEQQVILNWLPQVDYTLQQHDYINRRQPGTGQWLLDSGAYQKWLTTANQTLFCPGIPGSGKTILTAIVVQDLQKRFKDAATIGIAYLYLNYQLQDKQQPHSLLASLLRQLSEGQPSVLKDLYDQHQARKTLPSPEEISRAVRSVAEIYSTVFIIVDALDECQISGGGWKKFLSEIFHLQRNKIGASFFVTSRFIPDILDMFKGSLSLEVRATPEDVRRYLDGHMHQLPEFANSNPELREEIRTTIIKLVDGMFLLLQLHLDSLTGKASTKAIRMALTELPRGPKAYDQAYENAMNRIEKQVTDHKDLARKILSWIVCARRQLFKSELEHALAVETGESKLDEDNIPRIMVAVCAGLVTVDEKSNIIRLVHHTTQEYFKRTRNQWFPGAESDITTTCITYLSFGIFERGICPTDIEFEERLESNPLYDYAAHNWGHHARESAASNQAVNDFLKSGTQVEASIQALMAVSKYSGDSNYSQIFPRQITGLHLAAYFGVENAVQTLLDILLKIGHDPDLKDTDDRTPLSWAAMRGHKAVVEQLLATKRVDPDIKDSAPFCHRTPLSYASERGYEGVVKLLLATNRVNPDSQDFYDQSPLSFAAKGGHEGVVKLLLATNRVRVNYYSFYDQVPLAYAAEGGHEAVVKLLLATNGVDPDYTRRGQTPLSYAAENGHEAIVKLLLATKGVNPDSEGTWAYIRGRTPLSFAVENGHEGVVKLLLETNRVNPDSVCSHESSINCWTPLSLGAEKGHEGVVRLLLATNRVDVNSKHSRDRQTPLSWAAKNGHEAVVELLLATDQVDVNTKDYTYGQTPLSFATLEGHEAVVRLLLATNRVDVNSKGSFSGRTPLSLAAENGHRTLIEMLLASEGVDIDQKDIYGRPPLWYAAKRGDEMVVRLLLEYKAAVNAETENRSTVLHQAAKDGHERVVWLLLDHKADVNAKDQDGKTVLLEATKKGHDAVVRLLLEHKPDVNAKNDYGLTALHQAAEEGYEAIVRLLLEYGANANAKTNYGTTALHMAAHFPVWAPWKGCEAVVRILLYYKADVNAKNNNGGPETALHGAASKGFESVVRLLLEHGADVHAKDKDGKTALHGANENIHGTYFEHREAVVRLLLEYGADVNAKTNNGTTVLYQAAMNSYDAVIRLLLEYGVDINARTKDGTTALYQAVIWGRDEIVRLLLEHGADVNDGRTALLHPINKSEIVAQLLREA